MDTNKIPGKNIVVMANNYPIGCDENCDIEFTTSMITTTSKCDVDPQTGILWDSVIPNINSVKITGNGMVPFSTSQGYDEWSAQQLIQAQWNQLKIYVTWGIAGSNLFYGADAYLTTTKVTADIKDVLKYSYTIQITGKPTTGAVS